MKKFFVSEALLKQILARLEFGGPEWERDAVIKALRAELDQPVVEPVAWLPMDAAPKDGSLIRLLVNFDDHATEDGPGPHPTIGSNTSENDGGPDDWQFAGWNWEHDCYTQGVGTPVGWLPMTALVLSAQQPAPVQEPMAEVVSCVTHPQAKNIAFCQNGLTLLIGTKLLTSPSVDVPLLTPAEIEAVQVGIAVDDFAYDLVRRTEQLVRQKAGLK